ncbi:sensor histidine kinase [Desulfovibrio inopinatus]|uniref:sensor histidine kinase n=1 Tax=Desulfovibrio inopinatus TaxID=102109 RepID=UPI000405D7A2|nr:sensor histidine kinase [Desulfovibrio inopinatus]
MIPFPTLSLNLRHQVLLGFALWFALLSSIGAVSYYNLQNIERKVMVVEIADDLSNIILEMRRYEKNYFLYGQGYDENVEHVRRAYDKLLELEEHGPLLITDNVESLRQTLSLYGQLIEKVHTEQENATPGEIKKLRSTGQLLEEMTRKIVRFERTRIVQINERLRKNLFISMGMVILWGLTIIYFLNTRIIRPLSEVEATTVRIAEGDFEPVPMGRADNEILRIMKAINRMVMELERRQEQLVQNKKLSSIGQLASGIAHQLNNPLNNISTSCQLLMEEETPDPEFSSKMLNNIERETLRARDIVRGLLEFSRKREFTKRTEYLHSMVNNALALISSQVPSGVTIETWIPEAITVEMDRQQMQEVLLNLLMNGIQALGDNGTGLSVTAESDMARNRVSLVIEDDGCGLSDEVRGQIFDPFFTTKDVGTGTGLGLYIVYGIVRKHDGEICVEGKEGIGTRFVITLPIHAETKERSS